MNSKEVTDKKREAINQYASGDLLAARRLCEEICSTGASDHDVFCLLGIIAGKSGRYDDAVNYCLRSISLCPEHLDAYYNLGLSLMKLGRRVEATRALEFVTARRSDDQNAWHVLGMLKTTTGDYPGAIECFQAARRINPGFLDVIAGEAQVYEKQGDIERACNLVEPYMEDFPVHPQLALMYGKLMLRKGDFSKAIACLGGLAGDESINTDDRSSLQFLMGEHFDRSGNYDNAFRHYQQANELKGVTFDAKKFRQHIDGMLSQFNIFTIGHLTYSSNRSELPVFIIGSPRSGTSLVEQILASHKDVYGAGELSDITRIVEEFTFRAGQGETITTTLLDEKAGQYLSGLRELSPAATRITDKMPGNYFNLGYINMLFPYARIVHVSRNPLDTCLSCYFQDFSAVHTYAYDLENLGTFYQGYRQLMKHWKQVLQLRIHDLVYENLVENPEDETRKLLDFCGLNWDSTCLRYFESNRMIMTASYNQANKPIYKGSVNRWRHYEKYIQPLIGVLGVNET